MVLGSCWAYFLNFYLVVGAPVCGITSGECDPATFSLVPRPGIFIQLLTKEITYHSFTCSLRLLIKTFTSLPTVGGLVNVQ